VQYGTNKQTEEKTGARNSKTVFKHDKEVASSCLKICFRRKSDSVFNKIKFWNDANVAEAKISMLLMMLQMKSFCSGDNSLC
jgi:hypothetical protein